MQQIADQEDAWWTEGIKDSSADVHAAIWKFLDERGHWLIEDDRRIDESIHLQAVPVAYERILANAHTYRGGRGKFVGWMRVILTKACYELLRRSGLDEHVASIGQTNLSIEQQTKQRGDWLTEEPAISEDLDSQNLRRLEALSSCLDALGEQERLIVIDAPLPRTKGYSTDFYSLMEYCRELGNGLGLHWRKVLRLYHEAIRQLRSCLAEKGFPPTPGLLSDTA